MCLLMFVKKDTVVCTVMYIIPYWYLEMTVGYFTCSQVVGRLALQNLLNGTHFGLIKLMIRKYSKSVLLKYKNILSLL